MKVMNSRFYPFLVLFFLLALVGCKKDSTTEPQLTDAKVVGDYSFHAVNDVGMSYDLTVEFESNHVGHGIEKRYYSSGKLLAILRYDFSWSRQGNIVILQGVCAKVSSEGDVEANEDFNGEFEYKYGTLLPGKGFVDTYATEWIRKKKIEDVAAYVHSTVTYYTTSCSFYIEVDSSLDKAWPDQSLKYGLSFDKANYTWFGEGSGHSEYGLINQTLKTKLETLNELNEKERSGKELTEKEYYYKQRLQKLLEDYASEMKKGNTPFSLAVSMSGEIFSPTVKVHVSSEINPRYNDGGTHADEFFQDNGSDDDPVDDQTDESGIRAVDLGLSVKWASCDLGATTPEGYGDYYAWAETEVKDNYSWDTYKWGNGDNNRLTKYNNSSSYGKVDNKTVLEAADDVARVKLGSKWRMPTSNEMEELISTQNNKSYQWKWKAINGHTGWLVTYLVNNNSIFLPAAGGRSDSDLSNVGTYGYYWSSSLTTHYPICACCLCIDSGDVCMINIYRNNGFSIRPVTE